VDNAGNRTSKNDLQAGVTTNYGYDNIYQLLSATPSSGTADCHDLPSVIGGVFGGIGGGEVGAIIGSAIEPGLGTFVGGLIGGAVGGGLGDLAGRPFCLCQ